MDDEFFTKALQEDRYLKAIQLLDRFEAELRRELERVGDELVEDHPELFVRDAEADWNNGRSSSSVLAFARVDYVMDRLRSADEDAQNLKLNLSFRWVEPSQLGFYDVDGVLTVAVYKIKRAPPEDHQRVVESTRKEDWSVQTADDAFGNAPGVFYLPVETAADFREAFDTLSDHFSTFGTTYGVEP